MPVDPIVLSWLVAYVVLLLGCVVAMLTFLR
jgi:hypothetical protein